MHVHERQARHDRGREGRRAERRAGLRLHGRRRPLADQLQPRRRLRRDTRPTRARSRTSMPGNGYSLSRDRAERVGPDRVRRATTEARCRTSTSRPGRSSPAPSRTGSAAASWPSRTRPPTTRRTSRSRPAAASRRPASASTTTPTGRCRTRARSWTSHPARVTRSRRPCPPAGTRPRATCDDGSPVSNIDVAAGETVTCTFSNRKRGSLVVVEDAVPNDAQDFSFTTGGGLSPASLRPRRRLRRRHSSNTRTFADLVPGSGYSVSQSTPAGWDLDSATCDDGSPRLEHLRRRRARPSHARSCTTATAA